MTVMSFPALYFCALVAATGLAGLIAGQADAEQAASPLLQLEVKIPLGDVEGRIDHLAIDLSRKRLFIAELGNGALGIVDLEGHQVVHTISGLKEPQGVAYVPSTDTLFVTNAGDGSVLLFRGSDYEPAGQTRSRELMPTTFASMPLPIECSLVMGMAHSRPSTWPRTAKSPTFRCRLTPKVFNSATLPAKSL